jgi:hypothetical protein
VLSGFGRAYCAFCSAVRTPLLPVPCTPKYLVYAPFTLPHTLQLLGRLHVHTFVPDLPQHCSNIHNLQGDTYPCLGECWWLECSTEGERCSSAAFTQGVPAADTRPQSSKGGWSGCQASCSCRLLVCAAWMLLGPCGSALGTPAARLSGCHNTLSSSPGSTAPACLCTLLPSGCRCPEPQHGRLASQVALAPFPLATLLQLQGSHWAAGQLPKYWWAIASLPWARLHVSLLGSFASLDAFILQWWSCGLAWDGCNGCQCLPLSRRCLSEQPTTWVAALVPGEPVGWL